MADALLVYPSTLLDNLSGRDPYQDKELYTNLFVRKINLAQSHAPVGAGDLFAHPFWAKPPIFLQISGPAAEWLAKMSKLKKIRRLSCEEKESPQLWLKVNMFHIESLSLSLLEAIEKKSKVFSPHKLTGGLTGWFEGNSHLAATGRWAENSAQASQMGGRYVEITWEAPSYRQRGTPEIVVKNQALLETIFQAVWSKLMYHTNGLKLFWHWTKLKKWLYKKR